MRHVRPILHFTAETGWINDPHGISFHDGRYHLFHQYVPGSLEWAPNCHWGHATSRDLLHWDRRPVAIAPGDGDDGIWTGSVVQDGQRARILYTSVAQPDLGLGRIRLAEPADDAWEAWDKGDIVLSPPPELDLIAYRDPFVVREPSGWRMFVGAATRDGTAMALTYVSDDLSAWEYDGIALSRSAIETEPVWMGALWECPQLFEVDEHWVMVSSVWDADVLHYAGYGIGGHLSYGGGRFDPDDWGRLSYGSSYYAPSFFRDRAGRPSLMFWMRGVNSREEGWASCLSVPYVLSVQEGRLVAAPHPEVDASRGAVMSPGDHATAFDLEWAPATSGDQLVLASAGGKNARLTVAAGSLSLERPGLESWSMPWGGEPVRVIVDGPVVEISSRHGIIGGPIEPSTTWHPVEGDCNGWILAGP